MTRLNLMLLVAVLVSALYLVHVQYESRRLFTEIDHATSEAHRLELDLERLQLDRREQATPSRVERLAKSQLQMRTATPAITNYVTYAGPATAAASAPAQAAPAPATAREAAGKLQ